MTKRTKGPANRSHFERWLAWYEQAPVADVRRARSEFGYYDHIWDMAWTAWNAALDRHPRAAQGKDGGR